MIRSTQTLISGLVLLIVMAAVWAGSGRPRERDDADAQRSVIEISGSETSETVSDKSAETNQDGPTEIKQSFGIHIRRPTGPPVVKIGVPDSVEGVAEVACSTCHSVRKPNLDNKESTTLDEFHQGLKVGHGTLVCYSCHNPSDMNSLRAADGSTIEYPDVMTLCAQCHGPQAASYAHGAHGGMTGYWDLSRGPQQKNNCIDCHDPHAPSFPKMIVSFKPRERFSEGQAPSDEHP